MMTCIRLFATFVGYVVILLWVLGTFNVGDFMLIFRLR